MELFFLGLLLGVIVGWLTLGCYHNPAVRTMVAGIGRTVVWAFAVAAVSAGTGFLVWGIVAQARGEPIVFYPLPGHQLFRGSVEAIAWGAGLLVAGVAAFVLSFLGRVRRPPQKQGEGVTNTQGRPVGGSPTVTQGEPESQ